MGFSGLYEQLVVVATDKTIQKRFLIQKSETLKYWSVSIMKEKGAALYLEDSSYTYIPVKTNSIYEKHIHHLMVYMSVWYEILKLVGILRIIILRCLLKSRGKVITNPEWIKAKVKPYLHQMYILRRSILSTASSLR